MTKPQLRRWWIKERHNPQLGTYYVGEGPMLDSAAKKHERPIYGSNVMHPFETEEEFRAEIARLKASGERVH